MRFVLSTYVCLEYRGVEPIWWTHNETKVRAQLKSRQYWKCSFLGSTVLNIQFSWQYCTKYSVFFPVQLFISQRKKKTYCKCMHVGSNIKGNSCKENEHMHNCTITYKFHIKGIVSRGKLTFPQLHMTYKFHIKGIV